MMKWRGKKVRELRVDGMNDEHEEENGGEYGENIWSGGGGGVKVKVKWRGIIVEREMLGEQMWVWMVVDKVDEGKEEKSGKVSMLG